MKLILLILSLLLATIATGCTSSRGGSTSSSESLKRSTGGRSTTEATETGIWMPAPIAPAPPVPAASPVANQPRPTSPDVEVRPEGVVIHQQILRTETLPPDTENHDRAAAATQPSFTGGKGSGGAIGGNSESGFTIGGYSFTPTSGASRAASTIVFGLIMLIVAYFAMKSRQWIVAGACLALAIVAFVFPEYLVFIVLAGLGGAAYVVWRKHLTVNQLVAGTGDVLDHLNTVGGDVATKARLLLAGRQDDSTKAIVAEHQIGK